MYIIINKTTDKTITHQGNYPLEYIYHRLEQGDNLIIISTYSNTIKLPYLNMVNGINELESKEYQLPDNIISSEFIKLNK